MIAASGCPPLPRQPPDASPTRRSSSEIAAAAGTPCYVYNAGAIRAAYATLDDAFDGYPHAIHYALKANSSLAIVRLLQALGSHADANSMGEVDVALRCGFRPDQIVFTGVGKSAAEIDRAVALGLLAINVESPGELDRLDQRADRAGTRRRASRCASTPTSTRRSHPHISTGLKTNKFGVPIDEAPALFREMAGAARPAAGRRARPHRLADHHARSAEQAARGGGRARARRCAAKASSCSTSTSAAASAFPTTAARWSIPAEYVRALVDGDARQRLEGGDRARPRAGRARRRAADDASSTSSSSRARKRFVVLDAGMTELMRPALYGAFTASSRWCRRDGDADRRRHRRADLREHRHLRARSRSCRRSRSAISWWCATSAPTAR